MQVRILLTSNLLKSSALLKRRFPAEGETPFAYLIRSLAHTRQRDARQVNANRPAKTQTFLQDDDVLRDAVPDYFTRSPYERSVVFTRIFSPMLMKRGAMMIAPVSRVISF